MEAIEKLYVEVISHTNLAGDIMPYRILLSDEHKTVIAIGKVLDVRQAVSLRAGGQGLRYTVRLPRGNAYLFLEEGRWWMEAKRVGGELRIVLL